MVTYNKVYYNKQDKTVFSAPTNFVQNKYYLIVVTRDATSKDLFIYINGRFEGYYDGTAAFAISLSENFLVVGQEFATTANSNSFNPLSAFYGQMDEIRIYSK